MKKLACLIILILFTFSSSFASNAVGRILSVDYIDDISVSTSTVTALALKANLASPNFTGVPSGPTATLGTNTTQLATTAFVIANAGGGGPVAAIDVSFTAGGGTITSTDVQGALDELDSTVSTNNGFLGTHIANTTSAHVAASSSLAALDINWNTSNTFYKSISANSTFTFSNVTDGRTISVIITNTSGASVTITLPTPITRVAGTLTIGASETAVYTFIRANSKTYMASIAAMVAI